MNNGENTRAKITMIPGIYSSSIEAAGVKSIMPKMTKIIGMTSAIATPMKNFVWMSAVFSGFSLSFSMLILKTSRIETHARIRCNREQVSTTHFKSPSFQNLFLCIMGIIA